MKHYALLALFPSLALAQQQAAPLNIYATLKQESQYVTEGRDNLADGGIRSIGLTATEGNVSFIGWAAEGTEGEYQEINYTLEWAWRGQSSDGYIGYSHQTFEQNGSDLPSDKETSLGLATSRAAIRFAADAVYSKQRKGYFVELSARKEWPVKRSIIHATAIAGIDHDYASDSHHGENHYQASLGLILPLNHAYAIEAIANHSFAGKGVEADGLDDESFYSLSIIYTVPQ